MSSNYGRNRPSQGRGDNRRDNNDDERADDYSRDQGPSHQGGPRGGSNNQGRPRGRGGQNQGRGGGPRRLPDEAAPSGNTRSNNSGNSGFRAATGGRMMTREELANIKPTHVSKTSNDKNDPMIKAGFVLAGSVALAPSNRVPEFQLDYTQYITLLRSSYNTISRVDRGFAKTICESMYVYYGVILLWRRLYHVLSERSEKVIEAQELDVVFQHCGVQVPKDVAIYLSSIGNVTDFSERKAHLEIQGECVELAVHGAKGFYGQMGAHNHVTYETLPSPGVALLSIMADMSYTAAPAIGTLNWDLPAEVRPDVTPDFVPNSNLLGWRPARLLSVDQLREIAACGIIADTTFNVTKHVDNIPLNYDLLTTVSEALSKAKSPVSAPESGQYEGSMAQVLFSVPEPAPEFNRNRPICSDLASVKSVKQAGVNIASSATAFRQRIKRSLDASDIRAICYRHNEAVPPGWLDAENSIFDAVPATWNENRFTGTVSYGIDAAQEVSDVYLQR